MLYRVFSLVLIIAAMILMITYGLGGDINAASRTLVLGFLLLASYCVGYFFEQIGLPRITGYIMAGLIFGPWSLRLIGSQGVADLHFLNNLALAFIAFSAGGELKLANLRKEFRTIIFLLVGITIVVMCGVTLSILAISPMIPFLRSYPFQIKLAIAAIFGVICTARSPSSAIAIISETRAKGFFTDIVLSVAIAVDVVVIVLFAAVLTINQVLVEPDSAVDFFLLINLIIQIGSAFVIGYFLGRGIIFLIKNLGVELPIIIAGMGFMVIKFSHLVSDYVSTTYDITLHLEPLIICMAAGYTVQNFSKHGTTFLHRMDRVSMPIYVAFFAITGATINIEILKAGWILGLVIVLSRMSMLFLGTRLTGLLAGDNPAVYKNSWLAFITQAGVSLGLVAEAARRYPEVGIHIKSILIAAITVNQVVGPIAMKYVLNRMGETKAARDKKQ